MKKQGPHFYYMYHPDPDHQIHDFGLNDRRVLESVKAINKGVY